MYTLNRIRIAENALIWSNTETSHRRTHTPLIRSQFSSGCGKINIIMQHTLPAVCGHIFCLLSAANSRAALGLYSLRSVDTQQRPQRYRAAMAIPPTMQRVPHMTLPGMGDTRCKSRETGECLVAHHVRLSEHHIFLQAQSIGVCMQQETARQTLQDCHSLWTCLM